ncbi:hypothetical protein [Halocatena marina]|uniref:hypothetical protein n=1 Tax=Halocatena marina TaxID=2934937 RepID=UPI00200CF999|nr:hypothetical protein [Halocatena marina]
MNRIEAVVEWCSAIGVDTAVLPYLNAAYFDGAKAITEMAALDLLVAELETVDLKLDVG